jgi:hypothetical protein
MLADGRVLVAGGTETFPQDSPPAHAHEGHFTGLKRAEAFNPELMQWDPVADMHFGRWYPTLLTLPSGKVLVIGGHAGGGDYVNGVLLHANNVPEIYSPDTNSWQQLAPRGPTDPPWSFPRMFVLPDFRVFLATPTPGETTSSIYDPNSDNWTALPGAVVPGGFGSYDTSAVLLPLTPENGYRPRVMMSGQAGPAYLIDLGAANPTWTTLPRPWPAGGTAPARRTSTAVILATGDVLLAGGIVNDADYLQDFSRTAYTEIYNPDLGPSHGAGTWSVLDDLAPRPRGYHSTALLTADGDVWVAGSQYPSQKYSFHNEGTDPFDERGPHHDGLDPQGHPVHNLELDIDLYSPRRYCCHRPRIDIAPEGVHCGDTFTVYTADAPNIRRVAVVRSGSSTHAFNTDQRYVGLPFNHAHHGTLTVTAPPHTGIAPPGDYLLFLIDEYQVPSLGHYVRIHPGCAVTALLTSTQTHGRPASNRNEVARSRQATDTDSSAELADDLRGVRETILRTTVTGSSLIAILTEHNEELIRLSMADPPLADDIRSLIGRIQPHLSGKGLSRAFSDTDVADARAIIARLRNHASEALKSDLDRIQIIANRLSGRTLMEALDAHT